MHTVELLLDSGLEAGVRRLWSCLEDAGLPSLARHGHVTNRPHLTVVSAGALDGLPELGLPLAVELGPVGVLGRAVVWQVLPTAALTQLQAKVWAALPEAWPPPGEFVPHVSLALRVRADQHDAVLAALGNVTHARGQFVAARSYDTATRTVTGL